MVIPPIGKAVLIDYHFGIEVAISKFLEVSNMESNYTTEKELDTNQIKSDAQNAPETVTEQVSQSCKNGVCELNWKPTRTQAA